MCPSGYRTYCRTLHLCSKFSLVQTLKFPIPHFWWMSLYLTPEYISLYMGRVNIIIFNWLIILLLTLPYLWFPMSHHWWMPITNNVVNSNPVNGEVYSIQHYVIKFVSDLWQVSGFLLVLMFPPPIKLTAIMI